MHAAITLLDQDIDQAEQDLADRLGEDLRQLDETLAKAAGREIFEGVRPHLAEKMPSPKEFSHDPG